MGVNSDSCCNSGLGSSAFRSQPACVPLSLCSELPLQYFPLATFNFRSAQSSPARRDATDLRFSLPSPPRPRSYRRSSAGNAALLVPAATPQVATFISPASGDPTKLYVVNYFRETVRPLLIDSGPPFPLGPEIALAHSGQPRVPLTGALSPEEDGEWFLRSVNLLTGAPLNPNPVTCYTCHIDRASDNITRKRQAPPLFGTGGTGPWGWQGNRPDLLSLIQGSIQAHGTIGGPPSPGADELVLTFLNALAPPTSPFLRPDGTLCPAAQGGKALFERVAQCPGCHAARLFISEPSDPPPIDEGIGIGLAPINVPSLRGAWATAPYLHDGSAQTLMDALSQNPNDVHGTTTSSLTQLQLERLVAYLKNL